MTTKDIYIQVGKLTFLWEEYEWSLMILLQGILSSDKNWCTTIQTPSSTGLLHLPILKKAEAISCITCNKRPISNNILLNIFKPIISFTIIICLFEWI